jgi:S-formylglutathione hydrolase FrmB
MGGGGTFMYALHRPELFSSACPLSASAGPLSLEEAGQWLERRTDKKYTDKEKQQYFESHSAVALINSMDAEKIKSVRWFIDCGDDDFLYEGNALVHIAMKKKEIPHEYRVRDGAHNWTYWRESLPEVLKFVSMAFHQH